MYINQLLTARSFGAVLPGPGLPKRHSFHLCILITYLCLFCVTNSSAALANEDTTFNELTLDEVKAGSLMLPLAASARYAQVPAADTDIRVEVTGLSARHQIRQTFSNPNDDWLEAVYVYPLPDSAAVDELTMIIGEQRIVGEIQTRAQARRNYTSAKNNGQRASLVERQRPNLFTTRVANIPPLSEISIEIGFQSDVRYDDGVFSLTLPLTITPRYVPGNQLTPQTIDSQTFISTIEDGAELPAVEREHHDYPAPGSASDSQDSMANQPVVTTGGWGTIPGFTSDQVADAYDITPPITNAVPQATLDIMIESGLTLTSIHSTSHKINVTATDHQHSISPKTGSVLMNRDFVLQWQPQPGTSPLAAVFMQNGRSDIKANNPDHKAEAYASVMLIPPQPLYDDATPSREVIFVIDKSGSMDGNSLVAAKKALELGILGLAESDTFNVVMFNDQTSTLYRRPLDASPVQKKRAVASVRRIKAGGGTEIMAALTAALASTSHSDRVRQIVFITDGSVGNEAEIFKQVQKKLGNNRIFTVGIGTAPNRWFMRKTAELGRGTYTYIAESGEVAEKMRALFHKLERPVLNNIKLSFSNAGTPEFYPGTIPDLYAGEPVLINVRSGTTLDSAELHISGDENGIPWTRTLSLTSHPNNTQRGLDKLWAHRRITELENGLLFSTDLDGIKQQATDTALAYGLVSRYTSLVAIEQTIARYTKTAPLATREIPLAIPAGSNPKYPSHQSGSQSQTIAASTTKPTANSGNTTHTPNGSQIVSIPQTLADGSPMPIPQGNLGIVLHLLMSLVMSSSVAVGAWFTRRRKHAAV
jgi:Ca-activated chloride channel family protein